MILGVPGVSPKKGHSENDRSQSPGLTIKRCCLFSFFFQKSPKMKLFEANASHVNH